MKTKITKQMVEEYEAVRKSGVTNMFMVNTVCELSDLKSKEVIEIMKNYSMYIDKFKIKRR